LHSAEPTKEWVRKIQEDLDFLVKEADMAQSKATERIFARRQAVIEPMFNIVKLVAEFFRGLNLTPQKIKEGLGSRGLLILKDDYVTKFKGKTQDLEVLKEDNLQANMENLQVEFGIRPSPNLTQFVVNWGNQLIGVFQMLVNSHQSKTWWHLAGVVA